MLFWTLCGSYQLRKLLQQSVVKPYVQQHACSQGTTPGRAILKNISENSQEGLDSSQGRSSSSQQSQMAASAFAAVSQTNGFHGAHDENQEAVSEDQTHQGSLDSDEHSSQDRPAAQDELTAAESAQAEQQTAQHEQHQAQSPEADTDAGADTAQTGAKTAQTDVKDTQNGAAEDSQPFAASNPESEPLTETSLSALRLNTDASQSQAQALPASASGHDHDPAAGSPTAPASQGSGFAGSPAGSHTFDAELHDGIAALVQTPANIDTADHQPSHAPTSTEPDAAGLSIQGLTTPSSLESTSSQQGAEAAQEAAAASDQAPVYSLGSDEEDDLTVVSSKDQAREAQVSIFLPVNCCCKVSAVTASVSVSETMLCWSMSQGLCMAARVWLHLLLFIQLSHMAQRPALSVHSQASFRLQCLLGIALVATTVKMLHL